MPEGVSQVRYTDADVEQIRALFPDLDSLKLYRRYLLDLPLTAEEITRIKTTWGQESARAVLRKTTLPEINGFEFIGVGYDLLNNISTSEPNFDYVVQRTELFVNAIKYLDARLTGLDTLDTAATGQGKWLTTAILAGSWGNPKTSFDANDATTAVLKQLIIKQNVEGILVGLNAIVSVPVETEEEKAKRLAADSTQ